MTQRTRPLSFVIDRFAVVASHIVKLTGCCLVVKKFLLQSLLVPYGLMQKQAAGTRRKPAAARQLSRDSWPRLGLHRFRLCVATFQVVVILEGDKCALDEWLVTSHRILAPVLTLI